jgi:ferredoxin--NADP+ reductase
MSRASASAATETIEELSCGIVFRSIGYRGMPVEGLPFDDARGTIPHDGGRILADDGGRLRGDYVVGWIKRGPTGIIGTNKRDAQETVDTLLADLDAGLLNDPADPSRDALEELLATRAPEHVTYTGWEAIDSAEKAAGEPHGRPRVKLTTTAELLEAARDRVG